MRFRFAVLRPGKIAKTLSGLLRDILDDLQTVKPDSRELKDEVQHDPRDDPQEEVSRDEDS